MCENTPPSSAFVVLEIDKFLWFLYVKRYGKFVFKLLYADLIWGCV